MRCCGGNVDARLDTGDGSGEAKKDAGVANRGRDEGAKASTPVEDKKLKALSISNRHFIIIVSCSNL